MIMMWIICILMTVALVLSESVKDVKDVIVVGAGLSGAAAARTLHNTNHFRVTILEARPDRLGGRIWTDRSHRHTQGPECELGSPWLHEPQQGGEFSRLLKRLELTTRELSSVEVSTSEGPVTVNTHTIFTSMREQILDSIKQELSARSSKSDFSLDIIFKTMEPLFISNNVSLPWSTLAATLLAPQFGAGVENLSATAFQTGRLTRGVQILEGLDEIVNRLIGGTHTESALDVELGKVVRQIKVDYRLKKVKVRTVDRRSFTADAVILTLPLGVLKDGSVHFEPRLSRDKQEAIKHMGLGLVNTIILEFSQMFWSPDTSVFIAADHTADDVMFPVWLDAYSATNRPILLSHTYAEKAERLEKLSDDRVQSLAMESLESIFSLVRLSRVKVVSLTRSAWKKDTYAAGSSSFLPVGISLANRRALSQPISPYLYFAGEHTSLDKGGTLEGAYISGVEAAETLIRDSQTHGHGGDL